MRPENTIPRSLRWACSEGRNRFLRVAMLPLMLACGDTVSVTCPMGQVMTVEGLCVPFDAGIRTDSCVLADELCNGTDDDCDGRVDEGVLDSFFADMDADGSGDPGIECLACQVSDCDSTRRWVDRGDDCDDDCAECFPGASEICDGVDNNCVGGVDDGVLRPIYRDGDDDGIGGGEPMFVCMEDELPDGFSATGGDCIDHDDRVFPGQMMGFRHPIVGAPVGLEYDYDCDGTSRFYGEYPLCDGPICSFKDQDERCYLRDVSTSCGALRELWSCSVRTGTWRPSVVDIRQACR